MKNHFLVYIFVIVNVVLNFNSITSNEYNQRIDDGELCILKGINKEDFIKLDKNNFFLLYSAYDFIKKLC